MKQQRGRWSPAMSRLTPAPRDAPRVSAAHLVAIEKLTSRLDVPMSALLRGWIVAGLNAQKDEPVQVAIELRRRKKRRLVHARSSRDGPSVGDWRHDDQHERRRTGPV